MNKQGATIFNKLENLEKNLQRLKLEVFFTLPKEKQKFIYSEKSLRETLREIRKSIWQERYAKKI
ncbi:hypothetical protein KJ636_02930 [Patescibacteria group bacterium]|nr:hypothetical protein [Patescibacteria group bacterium]MBU4481123.1 hypothetical protein [Patescibacteria group bacterium]